MSKTHAKYIEFHLGDSSNVVQDLSLYVNTMGPVGLDYDEQEMTAWGDAVKNFVFGHPSSPHSVGGPWALTLHNHMIGINGLMTPRTLDVRIGIRAAWQAGDPQFGISQSASQGYGVRNYLFNPDTATWSAVIVPIFGVAPAWGTTAET